MGLVSSVYKSTFGISKKQRRKLKKKNRARKLRGEQPITEPKPTVVSGGRFQN